ncbi:NAD+ synthase [Xanthobacter sp.]|uniref:NAD+ synthase n=1 Tax=Xanthobacter sp. TaxID=35809 RepID=UPI0025CD194F|nr:NAD+ synthase [Xanthobacter sp.]
MTEPADTLLIAIAQLNPTVGDVSGNLATARRTRQTAGVAGADLVVFPELFIAGYPAEDLVLKPAFLAACQEAVEALAAETATGPAVLIGAPWVEEGRLFNSVLLLEEGTISAVRHKVDLPNYGVFDEKRVFAAGPLPGPIPFKGVRLGVPICEDIWGPDVVECLAETGAEILIVPNGSPYRRSVHAERENIAVARVVESRLPLLYVNQVGGQDELVFDGASFVLNADRFPALQFPGFVERVRLSRWQRFEDTWRCLGGNLVEAMEGDEADYAACVVGLRDYVNKNGFPGVVLGLSGGIDSALCAAMAVDALGPERVRCLMLPYRFTSEDSLKDAAAVAEALGVSYEIVPIAPAVEGLEAVLAPLFAGTERDVAEENLQARVRGTLLMSVSNKFGAMVVTTGNKSEMSTGYATLYGDMNGGFNPIKDLYKTEVLRLARLRNRWKPAEALGPDGIVIPEALIAKPPSAELRADQKDEDALPPYPLLDTILARLVEGESALDEIIADGFDAATVARVARLLAGAEYKRRQAAPGVKVTGRSFGRDRRYPITNRFREA